MIKVDASVFIQIINFLFLIWVMNKVVYKPIREVLKQRKAKVSGLEQQFDTFTNEAQEKDASQGIAGQRVLPPSRQRRRTRHHR